MSELTGPPELCLMGSTVRLSFNASNDQGVAFECTMGVDCRGLLRSGCTDFAVSSAPEEVLIAFPIEEF